MNDMIPPSRGRIASPFVVSVVRELNMSDIYRLSSIEITKTAPPPLQRLKATHHAAARLLASGKSSVDVALLVGRTPQRIRDLQKDPAFTELVAYYHDQITETELEDTVRLRAKLVNIAEAAVDEIDERLDSDEKRAKIPIGELRQIAEMGLDRTVAPPKTATPVANAPQNITFNIGSAPARDPSDNAKVIEQEKD